MVAVLIRELSVCVARARAGLLRGGVVVSVDEVNTSVDDADVEVEGRKYFYCGERNANELESSWAADDGSVIGVQRFLCGLFESDGTVEVVLMGDEY